jgi:hypothetical protein
MLQLQAPSTFSTPSYMCHCTSAAHHKFSAHPTAGTVVAPKLVEAS